ncbi:MAG TPA: tyrosine-type recombinase/integrase [Ktedonobacteraceae bacterium]|nr:tyrosine-type recombinase/integrase [Ktedonobacteraceae bacterium]
MAVKKPRRDYGDGSIYPRKDGRWVGSLRLPGGKRKYAYGKTRAEAKKKLEALKKQAEQGILVDSNKLTLSAYLDYWLTTIARSIEPSSVEAYRDYLTRVRKVLGEVRLQRLTRDQVQQFVSGLHLAPSTIKKTYATLDMALDAAVKWKFISHNPCNDVILPKAQASEQTILTAEQAKHLLMVVRDQPLEPFIVLALGTGMRKGEICALKWSDVDLERGSIRVDHKVYRLRQPDGHYKMTEGKPKSQASKRVIPMAPFVKEMLVKHRKRQLEPRLRSVEWQEKDLIFCTEKGTFYAITTLHRRFKEVLQAAGLPDIPIHRLRHTCNTLLRLMGVDAVTRRKILGHAREQETEVTYGHTYDELKIDAMDKLDRLFSDDDQQFQAN